MAKNTKSLMKDTKNAFKARTNVRNEWMDRKMDGWTNRQIGGWIDQRWMDV